MPGQLRSMIASDGADFEKVETVKVGFDQTFFPKVKSTPSRVTKTTRPESSKPPDTM